MGAVLVHGEPGAAARPVPPLLESSTRVRSDGSMTDLADLTGPTTELLQALIRNECVNDGTPESGNEVHNADLLESYLSGAGVTMERFECIPGRASMVARIPG